MGINYFFIKYCEKSKASVIYLLNRMLFFSYFILVTTIMVFIVLLLNTEGSLQNVLITSIVITIFNIYILMVRVMSINTKICKTTNFMLDTINTGLLFTSLIMAINLICIIGYVSYSLKYIT